MTPDQLLTFATVAELGSISRAAEELHLSQPAVSGQLRLLQHDFGQPLYRRAGRGIRLTATGEQLAGIARQLRHNYERARQFRDAIAGLQAGSLAIGASTTPASYLLPYVIADFRQCHPLVSLTLSDGNSREILDALALYDIAFVEGIIPTDLPPDVAVWSWRRDEVVAVVPACHPLAQRQPPGPPQPGSPGVSIGDLAQHPLVMREIGSGVRHQVTQAFEAAGRAMHIAFELAGVEGVKEAVRAGLGVGFVSAMAMRHDHSLVALHIDPPRGIGRDINVLVPHADALGAPVRAFLAICFPDKRLPGHANAVLP